MSNEDLEQRMAEGRAFNERQRLIGTVISHNLDVVNATVRDKDKAIAEIVDLDVDETDIRHKIAELAKEEDVSRGVWRHVLDVLNGALYELQRRQLDK